MTKMPEPQFSSWHGESSKSLINPTGVCSAFPWPPRIPEDEYWTDKGYHGEPLYTADQLKQYGRDLLEEAAKKCEDEDVAPTDCPLGVQSCIAEAIRAMKETI